MKRISVKAFFDLFRYVDWGQAAGSSKSRVALGLLGIGFLGASIGYIITYQRYLVNAGSDPWLDTWRGFFFALFTAGILTFGPDFLSAITESIERQKFRKFFGQDVFETGVEIVYQHSMTSNVVVKHYSHHSSKKEEWREYIGTELDVIIIPDMEAVNLISQLCGRMQTKVMLGFEDKYVTGNLPPHTLVSVGLLCNIAVHDACGLSRKLLTIEKPTKDPTVFHIAKPNGERDSFGGTEGEGHAVILRTLHRDDDGKKMIPFFVCGGSTEWGTKAAGLYLRRQWHDLLEKYEEKNMDIERDSLAAVVQFSDNSTRSVEMLEAYFAPGEARDVRPND